MGDRREKKKEKDGSNLGVFFPPQHFYFEQTFSGISVGKLLVSPPMSCPFPLSFDFWPHVFRFQHGDIKQEKRILFDMERPNLDLGIEIEIVTRKCALCTIFFMKFSKAFILFPNS